MPSEQDIAQQCQLIEAHRATLAHYLRRRALQGEANVVPEVIHGINFARSEIRRIKDALEPWGIHVEDLPDDDDPSLNPQSQGLVPASEAPVDFIIITALREEREAVLAKLSGHHRLPPSDVDINVYYVADVSLERISGMEGAYRIVILSVGGMGRIKAARAMSDAIHRWKPRYVIMTGIAGGIGSNVRLGDVLVSSQVVDYELQKLTDAEQRDGATGESARQVRYEVHPASAQLLRAVDNLSDGAWRNFVMCTRPDENLPYCHVGPIASGDKVIAFDKALAQYRSDWPKLIGVEMEAGGVATAAFERPNPPGFFMVRGVSDMADQEKGTQKVEAWRVYACEVAAAYVMALLRSGSAPLTTRAVLKQDRSGHPAPEVSTRACGFSLEDCNILAELLIQSGRATTSERRALCRSIGLVPGRLPFVDGRADNAFATELVHHLIDTDNTEALRALCTELKRELHGRLLFQLNAICTRLS